MSADRARPLTLGTAGHIDHGKTTLIKALTGRDTDRLKEEKERGISIELGFAELALPSGRRLSIVDVPGHERFVKTMVSGATGIDLFLLVVAADDGVMPQTREHLRIMELLRIPLGAVAITKIDAVEPELAALARADTEELLDTTFYAGAPIVFVSGVTGEGLPDLLQILDELSNRVPPREAYPATRMPIDRVFSLKGIGTVVTGTLWSGSITPEDTVAILPPPSGRSLGEQQHVRVRSVQVHDREATEALGGQRVALNLTGVDRQAVSRGQWVVKDPSIAPSFLVDVHMLLLRDAAAPLPRVSRARVDHGTAELLAKVVLADREGLLPGDSCYAQLRFEQSVLMCPGDQFILRSITPVTTLGGGRVVDPAAHKHGTAAQWRDRLATLAQGQAGAIAGLLLEECFPRAMTRSQLEESPYLWRFAAPQRAMAVTALLADGRATASGSRVFYGPSLSQLESDAAVKIGQKSETDPLNPYYTIGELRRELSGGKEWPALDAALEELQMQGAVVRTEYGYISSKAAAANVSLTEKAQLVLRVFSTTVPVDQAEAGDDDLGADTPSLASVADATGVTMGEAHKMIDALVRQRELVKVGEELYYLPEQLDSLIAALTEAMQSKGTLTLAEARDLLGTSRKYAQALLEHMDSEGLTLRIGDARRLRRRR